MTEKQEQMKQRLERVMALRKEGLSVATIAVRLGMSWATAKRAVEGRKVTASAMGEL